MDSLVRSDNIGGYGDYETVVDLINEGKDVCPNPLKVDCMTTTGLPATSTGEIVHMIPSIGCYCVNAEQTGGKCKYDYQARFLCCRECPYGQNSYWTSWFDRDNTGGYGDYETVVDLINEGKDVCKVPIDVECMTKEGIPAISTGEIVHMIPSIGCYCVNAEQTGGKCKYDYQARFKCCK